MTALDKSGKALPVASHLQQTYAQPPDFLEGTFVASSAGEPALPPPQGLAVTHDHSVRGVLWAGSFLLVADEPGDAVKVYDITGKLQSQIQGADLTAPVHLLLVGETLYISGGNDTYRNRNRTASLSSCSLVSPCIVEGY